MMIVDWQMRSVPGAVATGSALQSEIGNWK